MKLNEINLYDLHADNSKLKGSNDTVRYLVQRLVFRQLNTPIKFDHTNQWTEQKQHAIEHLTGASASITEIEFDITNLYISPGAQDPQELLFSDLMFDVIIQGPRRQIISYIQELEAAGDDYDSEITYQSIEEVK